MLEVLVGQGEVVQHDLAVLDARLDGGLEGVRLLHDLLEHEVLIAALLRRRDVPRDVGDLLLDRAAHRVVDRDPLRREVGDLALLQVDDVLRVRHEGRHVGAEEVLPHPDAQDQRRGVAGREQAAVLLRAQDAEGIGAL